MELEQRDMDDALEMDDVYQLVDIFPALTKANSQRLLEILKARKVSSFLDASTHLYKRVPSVRPPIMGENGRK